MNEKESNALSKGNLVVISPKVTDRVMFNYTGVEDLPDLIKFVGKCPVIKSDMTLQFRKVEVKEGDFIEVNKYGEVTSVLSSEIINKSFVLKARKPFSIEYVNKLVEKPPRTKK